MIEAYKNYNWKGKTGAIVLGLLFVASLVLSALINVWFLCVSAATFLMLKFMNDAYQEYKTEKQFKELISSGTNQMQYGIQYFNMKPRDILDIKQKQKEQLDKEISELKEAVFQQEIEDRVGPMVEEYKKTCIKKFKDNKAFI